MDSSQPPMRSLVIYKNRPARVTATGPKKIQIETCDAQALSVRPKDVLVLHPGPVDDLSQLGEPNGEVKTAIVVQRRQVSPPQARVLLARA